MTIFRSRLLSGTVMPVLALLAAGTANGQEAADAQSQQGTAVGDEAPIIVTGSRIVQSQIQTANPVVSVTAQDILFSGTTNLTDYLTTIPALQGSEGSFQNSGDRASIGYTGLNLLDLRNLGTHRTLVLVDGRRHVASVAGTQSVDINSTPTDLVERVDVLTGGTSAVYGADGVAGVVNIVQKRDFEGVTVRAQNGISGHGDAGQRLLAITAGHIFDGGRGNFAIAWEHGEEDRLGAQSRQYLKSENRVGFFLNGNDTETGSQSNDGIPDYVPLSGVRYNNSSRAGGIDVNFDGFPDFYGSQGQLFDTGTPLLPGLPRQAQQYQLGGSGTLAADYGGDLLPEINRDIVSGVFHYDFSDAFTVYAEGKYAHTRSFSVGQPTWDYYLFVPFYNPFIPAAVRPYVVPGLGVLVNRDNFDFGSRSEDIKRETLRSVIGARGDIAPNLTYDVSYVYGETKVTSRYTNNMITDRYLAAIDAVGTGSGGATCRVNIDPNWAPFQPLGALGTRNVVGRTTFSPGDCLPLNLFGENNAGNRAALDWIMADTVDRTKLTQHVVSGAVTGNSAGHFELPGGPLGFAVGGEYRKEKSSFVADELAAQGLTYTNSLGNTKGSYDVWEAFAEVDVPILADMAFAHRLDVDAAFRYSDYSTAGSTNAWKIGGQWAPVPDITFRGTYSESVRAPNINELFGATGQTFERIDDPCGTSFLQNGTQYRVGNCQALLSSLGVANPAGYTGALTPAAGFMGGNPDLKEETAETWTVGVILQPTFAPRLTITADWYDIRIKDAVTTASAETLAELCVDQPTLDNQYCDSILRQNGANGPAQAGNIISFFQQPFNVADIRTSGLDFQISYVVPTDQHGTFGARVVGNYLHRLKQIPSPGADSVNLAYVAANVAPKYQVTTDLTWTKGSFSFDWQINYLSKMYRFDRQTIASNPDVVSPEYLKIKERFSHDVSMSYDVTDQFQIYGGVTNLFDQKPDFASQNAPISAVGRYFFMGARVKLADIFGGGQ